jgi:cell division control protein 6
MDIEKYLTNKQQDLANKSSRIRDSHVFDFNYIPPKPLMREEAKPVIDAILRYQHSGIADNILILGCRGSGKSVMARYLMQILGKKGNLDFVYVNCRQYNTSFKILAAGVGGRPRGISVDELWYLFSDKYPGKTVVILDEIDLISEKDKNKDVLYLLSRSPNNYMTILLSNNPRFHQQLDSSIQSTLQPEIVHFRSYNALELQEILTDRARIGLPVVPKGIINEIAAMTVKNVNSDVRVAIKTLYCWAMDPEISIKDHFDKARRDILYEVIRDLNDSNLTILKSAVSIKEGYVKEIYSAYRRLCTELKLEPFSYVHFYANLSYLQSLGLIIMIATKIGRTYTNRIGLLFDPATLSSIWSLRFD